MTTYAYDENGDIIPPGAFVLRFDIEVPEGLVRPLVERGVEIWSYGYGQHDNDDPGTFTTLDPSDFDGLDEEEVEEALLDWGPFAMMTEQALQALDRWAEEQDALEEAR